MGQMDKAKGKAKEAFGAVTDDKAKKKEGQADKKRGEAKEKELEAMRERDKQKGR